MTIRPLVNSRPSVVGIGTGTVRPSRSRYWRSSVSHARSTSLLAPRRPTARRPLTRTLHTSLATPPASGSIRATSSPQCASASHPTGDIRSAWVASRQRPRRRAADPYLKYRLLGLCYHHCWILVMPLGWQRHCTNLLQDGEIVPVIPDLGNPTIRDAEDVDPREGHFAASCREAPIWPGVPAGDRP